MTKLDHQKSALDWAEERKLKEEMLDNKANFLTQQQRDAILIVMRSLEKAEFKLRFAFKPLNDGTKGFRFNFLGKKGLYRKRKKDSRGWPHVIEGDMKGYHMGKRSLYIVTSRSFGHFAG